MKKETAKSEILNELRNLLPEVPYKGVDGGMIAYQTLFNRRPDLFTFRSSGDKWQVVHGWMLNSGLVTK